MSTYYHFKCEKCKTKGGFFSRQMWGWGNFDIVDSFKFLSKHTRDCGEENIRVGSEHEDDDYKDSSASWGEHKVGRIAFLKETEEK